MATRQEQLDAKRRMINTNDLIDGMKKMLISGNKVVNFPETPVLISGSSGGAYTANDAMGILTKIPVPKSGIIYSATFWDLDDEKTQVDLEIFNHEITQIASLDPWAPSDADILFFVTELAFVSFDDHINSATSELTNIGKGYTAPEGFLWIQAVTRSTPTIAAIAQPKFQLQIIPGDLSWDEPTAALDTDMNRLQY